MKKILLSVFLCFCLIYAGCGLFAETTKIEKFVIDDVAVLMMQGDNFCSGTSVFTPRQTRVILSSAHCVANKDHLVFVQQKNGNISLEKVLSIDPIHDIVVLTNHISKSAVIVADVVRMGEQIRGVLSTIDDLWHYKVGIAEAYTTKYDEVQHTTLSYLVSNIDIVEGNSGGGILNSKDELVGMVDSYTLGAIRKTFLVTIIDIRAALENLND